MTVPEHHKEIFRHLNEMAGATGKVFSYKDDYGKRAFPVSEILLGHLTLYSTIGQSDKKLDIPAGAFEFLALGKQAWLGNAIVSSVYWLHDRQFKDWPIVCEDTIQINSRSTYRHMAYVPSAHRFTTAAKPNEISWLLGVPIKDSEIGVSFAEVEEKAKKIYPAWLVSNA